MRDQRLLLVGAGARLTDVLLPALRTARLPLRVTAVCDPAEHTRQQVTDLADAGLLPADVDLHRDLDDALKAGPYDLAIVACPHDLHQAATLALADAGVTVWKEKPFALTLTDAVALAHHPSAKVRVLAHRPHGQLYRIAAGLLPTWGRLLSYRIRIARDTSDYSHTWRALQSRSGGGAVLDLGYHAADLISRLASPPTTVYATTTASPAWRAAVEVEESAHLVITHPGGLVGSVELSRCASWADDIDLVTEGARVNISGDTARIHLADPGGAAYSVDLAAQDHPWGRMLRYHYDTLTDEQVTADETAVGVRATALLEAAYASLRSSHPAPVSSTAISALERIAS